ncbi:hypothetical protein [Candidatus Methylacidithermus pantelleriae]|uniref:Uncharacterized protein n=1 Tax=Candidatus Methylacidithermus pantelleriae TaxID=2744239 RepID=A0A8J2BPV5_9BACT|nr:hypothetical protein [Candidatus Methylacidithermus pantelleriae]CAF0700330.1 hypothetical protein MPNT_350014 [Candidatus Methylacidithermus pantelleriae]
MVRYPSCTSYTVLEIGYLVLEIGYLVLEGSQRVYQIGDRAIERLKSVTYF